MLGDSATAHFHRKYSALLFDTSILGLYQIHHNFSLFVFNFRFWSYLLRFSFCLLLSCWVVPPQWFTAEGWNFDGFLDIAENELDFPMCSWGTAHVDPTLCPYQPPLPGGPEVTPITSLYLKLRERNRCNNNDFQNVGVNGARITSANQLVDAIQRDQLDDKPVLLWVSLIGNDVCK